jgi:polysaccharide deacetylase 2 family uncharacterized protein YibQ
MARRRSRRRRSSPAPLLAVALLVAAAVVWAIYPRPKPHRKLTHVAVTVPSASPAAPASPLATATPEPSPLATQSPAATQSSAPGAAKLAIIIDDCGQWLDTERALIALPVPLTLSVLPHVRYTALIAQEASAAGKGVMLHLPMEPRSHVYPGPGEIKTGMTDEEVTQQTEDDVAQVPLAKGANNHEGSEASESDRVMKDVIAVMKEHDLFFIDSRTSAKSVAQVIAEDDGVATAKRDVFLDDKPDLADTEAMLERAVALAKANGSAIAIGHPKPTTLAAIRDIYPKLQAGGVQLVLAQDLVH